MFGERNIDDQKLINDEINKVGGGYLISFPITEKCLKIMK